MDNTAAEKRIWDAKIKGTREKWNDSEIYHFFFALEIRQITFNGNCFCIIILGVSVQPKYNKKLNILLFSAQCVGYGNKLEEIYEQNENGNDFSFA